jgi:hypothetical protein
MNLDVLRRVPLWACVGVGLAVESIDHPERFPLVSRVRPNKGSAPARGPGRGRVKGAASNLGRGGRTPRRR